VLGENAIGAVIEERDKVKGQRTVAVNEPVKNIVLKKSHTTII